MCVCKADIMSAALGTDVLTLILAQSRLRDASALGLTCSPFYRTFLSQLQKVSRDGLSQLARSTVERRDDKIDLNVFVPFDVLPLVQDALSPLEIDAIAVSIRPALRLVAEAIRRLLAENKRMSLYLVITLHVPCTTALVVHSKQMSHVLKALIDMTLAHCKRFFSTVAFNSKRVFSVDCLVRMKAVADEPIRLLDECREKFGTETTDGLFQTDGCSIWFAYDGLPNMCGISPPERGSVHEGMAHQHSYVSAASRSWHFSPVMSVILPFHQSAYMHCKYSKYFVE